MYPVYSYRDNKSTFGVPVVETNEATAIRGFKYAVNGNGIMNFSPADYDLYKIGEYDPEKGLLVPLASPEFVLSGTSAIGG